MSMVVPAELREEERELEGIAWKIRSAKNGMKTRLHFDDGARGLKLMVRSPRGRTKDGGLAATKMLVQYTEKHVAAHAWRKEKTKRE